MPLSQKIMLVPHCIYHKQPICSMASQAYCTFDKALSWLNEENYFIFPIPCPKLNYKGSEYANLSILESVSLDYRIHCRDLIKPLIEHLKTLNESSEESIGTIGLQGSATCDTINGVLMNELHKQLLNNNIPIDIEWYIPNRSIPVFNPIEHYIQHN